MTTIPPTDHLVTGDEIAALAARARNTSPDDVRRLQWAQRNQTRTRRLIAVPFLLIGAGLTFPALAELPPRLVLGSALAMAAAACLLYTAVGARRWWSARYRLDRPDPGRVWAWRIVRRWYAPGSIVWFTDLPDHLKRGPVVTLAWADDPACDQPWALIHNGSPLPPRDGLPAEWIPLSDLSPTPPTALALARPGGRG